MIKIQVHAVLSTYNAILTLAPLKLWEIYICELCYSDILLNYIIYACMLAEQLKKDQRINQRMLFQSPYLDWLQ